jgi:hypothetical protein
VTISDDKSNAWTPGPTTPQNPTNGQMVSSLYYALNVTAGTQKIRVTFDGLVFNFQAVVSEFYNVATVAAADGSGGSAVSSTATVSTGSFATTTSGDLVYSYAFDTDNTNAATTFTAGSGFTLLSADLQLGSVAQYAVQQAAGAINPTVTVTGGANPFNAVGLALKAWGRRNSAGPRHPHRARLPRALSVESCAPVPQHRQPPCLHDGIRDR